MPEPTTTDVSLTKLEVAASLAAVRAVSDMAPDGPPLPLRTSRRKYEAALKSLNEETHP